MGPAPGTSECRKTTSHDLPCQRIRERIRRSDLFSFFRDCLERWVNTLNEQSMRNRVHNRCYLAIKGIFWVRGDIYVHRLVRVKRRGICTCARARTGWTTRHRSIAITRWGYSPTWQGRPSVYWNLLCPRLQCRLGSLRSERRHADLHCIQGALWAIERHRR